MGGLLCDVILQVVDSLYLLIPCSGIDCGLLAEFSEPENLISNLVVGFFALGFLDEFLLQGHQLLIDVLNGSGLRSSDNRSDVKLQLCLIATFVSKHLIDGGDHNILQNQFVYRSGVAFQSGGFQPTDLCFLPYKNLHLVNPRWRFFAATSKRV